MVWGQRGARHRRTDIAFDHQQIGMTTMQVVCPPAAGHAGHLLSRLQGQRGPHRDRRAQRHPAQLDQIHSAIAPRSGEQLMSLTPITTAIGSASTCWPAPDKMPSTFMEAAEGHVLVGVLSKTTRMCPPRWPTCRLTPGLSTTPSPSGWGRRSSPVHHGGRAGPPAPAPARQPGCSLALAPAGHCSASRTPW